MTVCLHEFVHDNVLHYFPIQIVHLLISNVPMDFAYIWVMCVMATMTALTTQMKLTVVGSVFNMYF